MLASLSQELVHGRTDRLTDTADLCWRLYLRNLSTDRQTETDRQTHGRGYMYLAGSVHIVYCKAADLCERVDLSPELVQRQTDRQTDTRRGYMYLAQAIHTVRCKAANLCWRVDLSLELVNRTDRQTDTRTWLYVPGPGGTYIVYCKAVDLCWRLYLRNLCTDRQTDTDRQTHGRGYMYLARTVHIVYCKAADLCWHVDLSAELVHGTDRQTDTRTWLYVPGSVWQPGLGDGVIGGERQPETSVETVDPR